MNKERKRRIRELDARAKAREAQELEKNAERLKSMTGGFSRSKREPIKVPLLKDNPRVTPFLPAKFDGPPARPGRPQLAPAVLENLDVRNKQAAIRTQELQSRVGPVYNKGGYQFLTDSDLEDLRSGRTRRRS